MYLLDTHTLLWFLFENDNLSQKAQETIPSNTIFPFIDERLAQKD